MPSIHAAPDTGDVFKHRSSHLHSADSVAGSDDWSGYAYDNMGRLTGISYPSGVAAGYGYSNGKLTTMTATVNGATQIVAGSINYQPFAGISNWTYGNNVARTYAYDLDGRVTGIWAGASASTPVQGLSYAYNANDEITGISNGIDTSLSQTYGYGALSRLTSQVLPGNTMALTYDGVGNRMSRTDNGAATTYGYPAASHRLLSAVTAGNTRWFNTNGVGNIDAWHGADGMYNAMSYDAYLRPKSHARNSITTDYRFNALDQRVMKSTAGGSVSWRYIYAGQNRMLAERYSNSANGTSQWTSYLWLGGQPVGLVKGNTLYWVHADHLGRPEGVTNAAKQVVWRAANWAFDRGIVVDQIGGYKLGFPGQYYDAESNLWHNGFRDYEPTIGRYMQSDPIGLGGGISTYGYVGGNPVNYFDLIGLERFPGHCEALAYIDREGSVHYALDAVQHDRIDRNWEARTEDGDRLRNAENYLAAYVSVVGQVPNETNGGVTRVVNAGGLFWPAAGYHVVNALSGNNLRPHSPASLNALHATWAGLRDGNVNRTQSDPDCGCK